LISEAGNHVRKAGGNPPFGGHPRVLVVEDDVLLALEITQILSEAGFVVIGPARSVAQALDLAGRAGCQAAVLDVGLRLGTSEPVARELRNSGTPFIALSGYSQERLPRIFSEAPFIAKPFDSKLLIAKLRRCVDQGLA